MFILTAALPFSSSLPWPYSEWRSLDYHESVAGVMVSIVALQAVDPGSIPGRRTFFVCVLEIRQVVLEQGKASSTDGRAV